MSGLGAGDAKNAQASRCESAKAMADGVGTSCRRNGTPGRVIFGVRPGGEGGGRRSAIEAIRRAYPSASRRKAPSARSNEAAVDMPEPRIAALAVLTQRGQS